MENAQFLRIRDRFDGITKAFRDRAKAKIKRFEDGLTTGGEAAFMETLGAAFHSAFLAELLGEGHGCSAVRFRTNRFYRMEEGVTAKGQKPKQRESRDCTEADSGPIFWKTPLLFRHPFRTTASNLAPYSSHPPRVVRT